LPLPFRTLLGIAKCLDVYEKFVRGRDAHTPRIATPEKTCSVVEIFLDAPAVGDSAANLARTAKKNESSTFMDPARKTETPARTRSSYSRPSLKRNPV
jgi:hypothetical protein